MGRNGFLGEPEDLPGGFRMAVFPYIRTENPDHTVFVGSAGPKGTVDLFTLPLNKVPGFIPRTTSINTAFCNALAVLWPDYFNMDKSGSKRESPDSTVLSPRDAKRPAPLSDDEDEIKVVPITSPLQWDASMRSLVREQPDAHKWLGTISASGTIVYGPRVHSAVLALEVDPASLIRSDSDRGHFEAAARAATVGEESPRTHGKWALMSSETMHQIAEAETARGFTREAIVDIKMLNRSAGIFEKLSLFPSATTLGSYKQRNPVLVPPSYNSQLAFDAGRGGRPYAMYI